IMSLLPLTRLMITFSTCSCSSNSSLLLSFLSTPPRHFLAIHLLGFLVSMLIPWDFLQMLRSLRLSPTFSSQRRSSSLRSTLDLLDTYASMCHSTQQSLVHCKTVRIFCSGKALQLVPSVETSHCRHHYSTQLQLSTHHLKHFKTCCMLTSTLLRHLELALLCTMSRTMVLKL